MSRLVICVLLMLSPKLFGQTDGLECVYPSYFGRLSGEFGFEEIEGIAVQDGHAYLTVKNVGLVVADVRDPSSPVELSRVDIGIVRGGISVFEHFAVVFTSTGVSTFDVSDPFQPALVDHYAANVLHPGIVRDDLIYLPDRFGMLSTLSIQPDGQIESIAQIDLELRIRAISESNGLLFAYQFRKISALDVSRPADPLLIHQYDIEDTVDDLNLNGDRLLITFDDRVELNDVSNPTSPQLLSTLDLGDGCGDTFLAGNTAYICQRGVGVSTVVLGTNGGLEHVSQLNMSGGANVITIANDIAYCGMFTGGMQLYDANARFRTSLIDIFIPDPGTLLDLFDLDDLYILKVNSGLYQAYNADPDSVFEFIGDFQLPIDVTSMTRNGDYLYVSSGSSPNARTYYIKDYGDPQFVSLLPVQPSRVVVLDGLLYSAEAGSSGLAIVDVHNPEFPVLLSEQNDGAGQDIVLTGDYAIVALSIDGLAVYDISDPKNPVMVYNEYDLPTSAFSLQISGDYLFVEQDSSWSVYDVSDPTNPSIIYESSTTSLHNTLLHGDRFYIAGGSSIEAFDVSDPGKPSQVGSFGFDESAYTLLMINERLHAVIPDNTASGGDTPNVSVLDPGGCSCPADLNADGALNFFDISAFLIGYQAQDPLADWNGDGSWDFFDVSGFLEEYLAGCP